MLTRQPPLAASVALGFAIAAAGASSGVAAPSSTTVSFQYEAPDPGGRCPASKTMENAIAARLGFFPFDERGTVLVRATIRSEAQELIGVVEMTDQSGKVVGRRVLRSSSSDCEGLTEAMAVAISVALEPLALRPPESPRSSAPASFTPAPAPPSSSASSAPGPVEPARVPPLRNPHAEPIEPPRLHASLGAMTTTGTTPGTALGVTGQVGIRRSSWSAALEGRAELVTVTHVDDSEVHTSLVSGWLVPCWQGSPWMACAIAGAGSLRVEGKEVDEPKRDQAFYAALGGRVGAEIPVYGSMFLRLHGDLAMALTRTTFFLSDQARWSSSPVHLGAGLALGRFF
jgi:hypothetical protein